MDEVFRALADPSRRELLDRLRAEPGQSLTQLCAGLNMRRQSVSKHLAVLEGANLVTTLWRGREKLHFLNPAPIADIGQRWIRPYQRRHVDALTELKTSLEDPHMEKPHFVYTTYIASTPERVWQALTDPEFTSGYWGVELETDWKVGSPITWHQAGVVTTDPGQVVLEADPFRRLAYTWHRMTEEWIDAIGSQVFPIDSLRRMSAEPLSRVTFEIAEADGAVKLTVVHDDFETGSLVFGGVSQGWPRVIAALKSFVETGRSLNELSQAAAASD